LSEKGHMADIAAGRAALYALLVSVFRSLPDTHFIAKLKGPDFQDLLDICESLDDASLTAGVARIRSYRSNTGLKSDDEMLTELSVDRTSILRATGSADLGPPYEGVYKSEKRRGASALQVKGCYRKAGVLPDETIGEPPDYLCVELDFMHQLCRRERAQWLSTGDVAETIARQEEFLRDHLGSWIGEFCSQAGPYAATDFYKGFLILLDRFVRLDLEYLQSLTDVSTDPC
jgi:TorA maturation chaperone TorD